MKRLLIVLIFLIISVCETQALFDSTYWGVRAFGMGGAFTAVSDDANGPLYNAAGAAGVDKGEVTLMSAKLFTGLEGVDMSVGYAGIVYPLGLIGGSVCGAWSYFGNTGISREDTLNIGYARGLEELGIWEKMELSVGFLCKYIRQEVDFSESAGGGGKESKGGFTFDLGMLARFPLYGISLGISSKYITRPDVGFKYEDKVPVMNVIGLSYSSKELYLLKIPEFTIAADYQIRSGDEDVFRLGMESVLLGGRLALRAGGWKEQINFGAGYEMKIGNSGLQIDYGFGLPIELQDNTGSHFLSLTYKFP